MWPHPYNSLLARRHLLVSVSMSLPSWCSVDGGVGVGKVELSDKYVTVVPAEIDKVESTLFKRDSKQNSRLSMLIGSHFCTN